jgi:hypothetical protein
MKFTRRNFLSASVNLGLGCSLAARSGIALWPAGDISALRHPGAGKKHLFADDVMIARLHNAVRKVHAASKLEHPVLEADKPWEQGELYDGQRDRRVYIYGTVMRDPGTDSFRMWYNRLHNNLYATSKDGVHWDRPNLGQFGENNRYNLFHFHSPSVILDHRDPDPAKRYKAVGSTRDGYCAAFSADGLHWNLYPTNPILKSSDTITLAQDPANGEYLAFHKRNRDPRTKGRQVFLSVSKDMQNWSDPAPVMVTDEIDHQEARLLEGGTHAEFYNMSAFPYGDQWLGMVTLFRRTGEPKVIKYGGNAQSHDDGPIDIRLVHSRDGRTWKRCSDRSPVIALGPYHYDSGSILGLCNSPVIYGDEMWMYYTAMTTTHGGYLPDKVMSIARASWRVDGLVSLQAGREEGIVETVPFKFEGSALFVNANVAKGSLSVEVLREVDGEMEPHGKCLIAEKDSVKIPVVLDNGKKLPSGSRICLRFRIRKGDLYSYTIA